MIFQLVNVTDAALVSAAVHVVVEELGSVDILPTFAGIVGCFHEEDMAVEQWNRIWEVNLTSSFHDGWVFVWVSVIEYIA